MKEYIKKFCNIIIVFSVIFLVSYVTFFTNIPSGVSNEIKEKVQESKFEYEEYSESFNINDLSITLNSYYYDKLTENEKQIYEALANGVKNFREEFSVKDYSPENNEIFAEETSNSIEAFINDHPEVFYLKAEYSTYVVNGINENIGYVKINYTEKTKDAVDEKYALIKEKVDEYVNEFSSMQTNYDKEVGVHDKLAKSLKYYSETEIPRKYHTIEAVLLENVGVCDGFSKALQVIYNKLGIDSIIALGKTSGGPHAWNLVQLDDGWYHVDLTSARSIVDETGIVNHAYFNVTDAKIQESNEIDTPELLPHATSTRYYYYSYNDIVVPEDRIKVKLEDVCAKYKDKEYIEFYLDGNVENNMSRILAILREIDPTFLKDSKMYYYNIQNGIIIPKN